MEVQAKRRTNMETTLTQIYNTLCTIDTHGDSTMKMAMCLDALAKVIQDLNSENAHTDEVDA